MDDLDKQIEEMKERVKKTQQLNELKALEAQISPRQANANDPINRLLKFALPGGIAMGILALIVYLPLHQFLIGLMLAAISAAMIGFKLGLTPNIRIPIIDDRNKQKQQDQPKVG